MSHRQALLSKEFAVDREFGGALLRKSHAKKARPISTKCAMHVTLRSSKAKNERSFLHCRRRRLLIEAKIHELAKKFGIKVYKIAIVGNHIHLLLRPTWRGGFVSFLRSITGIIARIILGVQRGPSKPMGAAVASKRNEARGFSKRNEAVSSSHINEAVSSSDLNESQCFSKHNEAASSTESNRAAHFWDQRPWSRVVAWMKDFELVKKYVQQNFNEAFGFVPYKPRAYRSTA